MSDTPTITKSHLSLIVDLIHRLATQLNIRDKMDIVLESKNCDPCVVIDEWLTITPEYRDIDTIGGSIPRLHWIVSVANYNPGVWRYADGSGEPPSVDIDDVKACRSTGEAASLALELWFKQQIRIADEQLAAQDEAKSYQEDLDDWK